MMGYYGGLDGWGWLPMLIPTLLWAGVIGLGLWALLFRDTSARRQPEAVEILKGRYARGDIEREEYLERRRHLL